MKKVAIGCLVVAAVLVVVLGVGAYLIYRAASPYIAGVAQLAEIPELEKAVANTSAFSAPEGDLLTEQMVSRFAAVQEAMQAHLGPRLADLKAKAEAFDRMAKEHDRKASPAEALAALSGLATLLVEGKRAQVEALNKAGFSHDEYRWVRERVYEAAGIALSELNLSDPQALAEAARNSGGLVREVTKSGAEAPARNKELVAPYVEKLKEWLALGLVGL